MEESEIGAQYWTNLQIVVGQCTSFPKSATQILSPIEKDGALEIDYKFQCNAVLTNVKGASSAIKHLPPNMSTTGLGFHIAADRNQDHEYTFRFEMINHLCSTAVSTQLNQREAFYMLQMRVTSQTSYVMRLTQFFSKQCHKLDIQLNITFLHLLIVNRKMPRAVVHSPLELGG